MFSLPKVKLVGGKGGKKLGGDAHGPGKMEEKWKKTSGIDELLKNKTNWGTATGLWMWNAETSSSERCKLRKPLGYQKVRKTLS